MSASRPVEPSTIALLGGPRALGRPVRSLLDVADAVGEGLPRASAEGLRRRVGMTWQELAAILGVSARTLQRHRRAPDGLLASVPSDRLYRLARIVALAEAVLEDADRAHRWLREAQRGLGARVPLELIRTEAGAREVEDLLGRIEFGVFS